MVMHQARNLVTVVLGGIETDNFELAKRAVAALEAHIVLCEWVQRAKAAKN